jgi:hypothetical protein
VDQSDDGWKFLHSNLGSIVSDSLWHWKCQAPNGTAATWRRDPLQQPSLCGGKRSEVLILDDTVEHVKQKDLDRDQHGTAKHLIKSQVSLWDSWVLTAAAIFKKLPSTPYLADLATAYRSECRQLLHDISTTAGNRRDVSISVIGVWLPVPFVNFIVPPNQSCITRRTVTL